MAGEMFSTYDQVGLAEEVADVISNISPTKTPFLSSIGTEGIDSRHPEWQEDSLAAAADNAQVEGYTATEAACAPTVMRSNYTQIFDKTIKVSATAERVKKYGRKSEIAYQLSKRGAEAKRDLEYTLVGLVQAAAVGDETSTARRMASSFSQIAAGVTSSNGGTPRAFSEALVLDVAELVFNEGGETDILMIKPADSTIAADFAKASGRVRDPGNGTKVVNAVDLYISPFGEHKVVLNRFLKTTEALMYSPDNWKRLVLRNWSRTKLAITGDNERHMLNGEFSLKHVNQKASGRITDLS